MPALTEIGEIGLDYQGREYVLRPSLAAMARLGTPAEIVETFGLLHGAPRLTGNPVFDRPAVARWKRDRFLAALSVLHVCCDDDLSALIGGITPRMTYQPGAMPLENVTVLARELLRHGIVGDSPPDPRAPKGKFVQEFHAREHAGVAMAHLGLNEADAWRLTMTGLVLALRAKYPPAPDQKNNEPPTSEAHDATMSWLAAVNAKRASRDG